MFCTNENAVENVLIITSNTPLTAPIIFPIIEIMEAIILATKVTIGEITDIIVEIIPPINDTIGEMAAEAFKDAMDAKGVTSGVLGMNTNVENEALNHRIDGFRNKIAEIAPELELTDTYYNGNDVETAQKNAENIISTYGDKLIGMYSGNNITGDGVCNAVADSNVGDKFINVAVDSDDIEIQALKNGVLDAIIVQDAYAQGYKCMENALRTLIDGKNPESKKQVNCPPVVITKDNMDDSDMQDLLDPTRLQK